MKIFEELENRELIAQVTNREKVKEILNENKVYFYIGFDPTADALHVGHLAQIMIASRLQRAGHVPIILFGGGTALIGDPSGKTDMRKMLTADEINHNIERFKTQASKFIDFSPGKALIVNNADWLMGLNYVKFLREIGVHFSVNRMLAAECYKQRLERGLTFFEMNYMVMQGYDFLVLNRKYGCSLELGGDDQWSNIISGVELIRKCDRKEAYGLTFKLLTTSEGKKMGKTEKGAVWLDPQKTSPYDFYQYWRNVDDKDVVKCMQMLTHFSVEEIKTYSQLQDQEINKAKDALAFEITKLVHGENEAKKCQDVSRAIFETKSTNENMPSYTLEKDDLADGSIGIIELLCKSEMCPSKSEARRLVQQGGISVNDEKITDIHYTVSKSALESGIVVRKGKKIFKKISSASAEIKL